MHVFLINNGFARCRTGYGSGTTGISVPSNQMLHATTMWVFGPSSHICGITDLSKCTCLQNWLCMLGFPFDRLLKCFDSYYLCCFFSGFIACSSSGHAEQFHECCHHQVCPNFHQQSEVSCVCHKGKCPSLCLGLTTTLNCVWNQAIVFEAQLYITMSRQTLLDRKSTRLNSSYL